MNEFSFMVMVVFFLSFFILLTFVGMPFAYSVFTTIDIFWIFGQIAAVTAACVIADATIFGLIPAGVLCTLTLLGTFVVNAFMYLVASDEYIKIMIVTPILLLIYYIILKFARGSS